MAGELQISPLPYSSGFNVYVLIWNATGSVWNGASFASYLNANWSTYAVTLTEKGTSGNYVGDMPATITVGIYRIQAYITTSGATPTIGDQPCGSNPAFNWTGTAVSAAVAYLPQVQAGANNGVMISGANTGPWSVSAGVTFSNSAGTAFTCTSTFANSHGIIATGGASGNGMMLQGGSSGQGLFCQAGTGGHGARFLGLTSGHGIWAQGGGGSGSPNGDGIHAVGGSAASGVAGVGISATGGAASTSAGGTAGFGFSVTGGSGAASANGAAGGALFQGGGTNTVATTADGIKCLGTSNGSGFHGLGGATSGWGSLCEAQASGYDGIKGLGKDNGAGCYYQGGIGGVGTGGGTGLICAGGDVGDNQDGGIGLSIIAGGSGTGDGGRGVNIEGVGTNGDGIYVKSVSGIDIHLAGDGLLQGDIGGRILGNTATVFSGAGTQIDLTQAVPRSNTSETVGDSMHAARVQGFGKWVLDLVSATKTLTLYESDDVTVAKQFTLTLDGSGNPIARA